MKQFSKQVKFNKITPQSLYELMLILDDGYLLMDYIEKNNIIGIIEFLNEYYLTDEDFRNLFKNTEDEVNSFLDLGIELKKMIHYFIPKPNIIKEMSMYFSGILTESLLINDFLDLKLLNINKKFIFNNFKIEIISIRDISSIIEFKIILERKIFYFYFVNKKFIDSYGKNGSYIDIDDNTYPELTEFLSNESSKIYKKIR